MFLIEEMLCNSPKRLHDVNQKASQQNYKEKTVLNNIDFLCPRVCVLFLTGIVFLSGATDPSGHYPDPA